MKSFQDVFDIDDNLNEEEAKRMEEEIREHYSNIANGKKADDYSFDFDFNEAIESKFYEPESDYLIFIEMEYNFNSIYLYFQYTRRYVKSYEAAANDFYNKQMSFYENHPSECCGLAEVDLYLSELTSHGDLICLNCQSTLLMAYSAFEAFLRQFIELIDEKAGILKYPYYDDRTPVKYLDYLNYEKNIFIPKKLYRDFSEIRLVRNYYAHRLDGIQIKLKRMLGNDPYNIIAGGQNNSQHRIC